MAREPFYFVVVFWGEAHRAFFLRLCASSLLSGGNIPSRGHDGDRFVICTTAEDWAAMQDDPVFIALRAQIAPRLIEIPRPGPDDNKYLVMSSGHRLASERAFADGAAAIYLTPDLVLSDGSVRALTRLAEQGRKIVLCAALRFTEEGCIPEIDRLRPHAPGAPLVLPPRTLAGIALRNMHVETLRYDWDSACFADLPFSVFWRARHGNGILVHSFSWAPLLVSYRNLARHDTKTFDAWTLDGDYIHRNFPDPDAAHVVRDSDEILLASFTPADALLAQLGEDALAPEWHKRAPIIGRAYKRSRLRWVVKSGAMDALKLRIFGLGVRMHDGTVPTAEWSRLERAARRVIARIQGKPGPLERVCADLVERLLRGETWPLRLLENDAPPPGRLPPEVDFVNQSKVGSCRAIRFGVGLSAGKWYWEIASPNLGALGAATARTATVGVMDARHSLRCEVGARQGGWAWRADGHKLHGGWTAPYGNGVGHGGAVMMVAFDADNGRLWFGRDGAWFDDGAPDRGTAPAFAGLGTTLFPAMSSLHGGGGTALLGARTRRDRLRHAPPSGFLPLSEAPAGAGQTP